MSKKNRAMTGRRPSSRTARFSQNKDKPKTVPAEEKISEKLGNVIVVDTNVLINDPRSPFELIKGNNLLIIPMTVIEELDGLKKRLDISEEARQAIKIIYSLQQKKTDNLIISGKQDFKGLDDLARSAPDNRIIATFNQIVRDSSYSQYRKFKFITDDYCVLLKASNIFSENEKVEIAPYRHIRVKFQEPKPLKPVTLKPSDRQGPYISAKRFKKVKENGAVVFTDGTDTFLALRHGDHFIRVDKDIQVCGLKAMNGGGENWEQQQLIAQLLDSKINIVLVSGVAGTGKTLLALAAALQQRDDYSQIVVTRPAIPLEDKDDLGFLPGDLNAKMAEYVVPFVQDLEVIIGANGKNPNFFMRYLKNGDVAAKTELLSDEPNKKKRGKAAKVKAAVPKSQLLTTNDLLTKLRKNGIGFLNEIGVAVNAVQHYRGRTYHHSFIIIDEAQNLTPLQVKTIMTRIGNGSKIVLTGDLSQIDRRFLTSETSGLAYAIAKMAGNPMVAVVKLIHTVRSKISAFAEKVL